MTVKELIDTLAQLPPDLEVLLASDDEGNNLRTASGDWTMGYAERSEWEGYRVVTEDDWDDYCAAELDEPEPYPGDNAVVLWP